jgi:hypothetical protein
MTEEQQKPVIKITDHYFTDDEIVQILQNTFEKVYVSKDDKGFYYRTETEI